ncbi:hypothetical protein [Pseudomonas monteilii]|uniref:hypothetical protein n=1 Tax=Pseudomonas monteilii TaxID=76759 RepID=UPI0018A5D554|nr:hypothetical protein [Pseudomonas monteilii]BBV94890.1 hypothetical protein STW0522PSE72_02410 [Pseudomonas monteilii]
MENKLVIKAELSPEQANALLASLKSEYRVALIEQWWADTYRYVPEQDRHTAIVLKNPVMGAQRRLIGALSYSLKSAK